MAGYQPVVINAIDVIYDAIFNKRKTSRVKIKRERVKIKISPCVLRRSAGSAKFIALFIDAREPEQNVRDRSNNNINAGSRLGNLMEHPVFRV